MSYDQKPWLGAYDAEVRPEIVIRDKSLKHRFEDILQRYPSRHAYHFLGVSSTFEQLHREADRFARGLVEHGLERGDLVAINLPNLPQFLIAALGAFKAGCAISGLSPLNTADEMAYQLEDCGAKALVTLDPIFQHRLVPVADKLPQLKLVISAGILEYLPKFKQLVAKWLKKVPTGKIGPLDGKTVFGFRPFVNRYDPNPPRVELDLDDVCIIQYTGGTTGPPKGAVLSHGNMLANSTQWEEWTSQEYGVDVMTSGFPMFHIAGLFTGLNCMAFGVTQALIPNPRDTKHIVGEMHKYKATMMTNVPSLYLMLLKEPGFLDYDYANFKFALSGAAPFPPEGIAELEKVITPGRLVEVYGMTETSPLQTATPYRGPRKKGSVGLPVPSTVIRIMDVETGEKDMPFGEPGEIVCSGPQVMQGYHNKPAETSNALRTHDGSIWMHTGDVGYMDEDGFVFVVDRTKDMINVSGFKVFSSEVEDKLYHHPAIEFCAIIGAPNPKRPESELV